MRGTVDLSPSTPRNAPGVTIVAPPYRPRSSNPARLSPVTSQSAPLASTIAKKRIERIGFVVRWRQAVQHYGRLQIVDQLSDPMRLQNRAKLGVAAGASQFFDLGVAADQRETPVQPRAINRGGRPAGRYDTFYLAPHTSFLHARHSPYRFGPSQARSFPLSILRPLRHRESARCALSTGKQAASPAFTCNISRLFQRTPTRASCLYFLSKNDLRPETGERPIGCPVGVSACSFSRVEGPTDTSNPAFAHPRRNRVQV